MSDVLARADRFVDLACLTYVGDSQDRRAEATALLTAEPSLVGATLHAAAAAGDVDAVRDHLDRDSSLAGGAGGPRSWSPLLSLCYSRVPQHDALGCLELVLARGGDPDAHTTITECRFTALTGVMGEGEAGPVEQPPHPDARRLAVCLLDAGASPNESQGLYNTHFQPSNDWLELLLARGLTTDLDFLFGRAARQGFADRVQLLLAHGANPDGRDHYNKRRHIENALLEGQAEIARMLDVGGAQAPQLSITEEFRAAVLRNDEAEARRLLASEPSVLRDAGTLAAAARHGNVAALGLGLALGLQIDATEHGLTALHHAAGEGQLEATRELLAHGASTTIRDPRYDGTPLGHARHFAERWPMRGGDAVVALLAPRTPAP